VLEVSEAVVSLVIPVYNGEPILAASLDRVVSFIDREGLDAEIIVVDDGSTDGTFRLVEARDDDRIRGVRLSRNSGKFAALKAGMATATGGCRVFTDADIPYDLEAIPYMADLVSNRGFHIVVGDRTLTDSAVGDGQPMLRRMGTQAFSFSVRMLVTGELFDTQVGLKAFRGDVAAALFPLVTDDGFAGDVELLYIALKYNLAIRRIPVRLLRTGPSTVRLASHALPMLVRIAGLRRRWSAGGYDSAVLRSIAEQRYWNHAG
jgi:glycosyltransferase involved in cell wall biosynthesis